MQTTIRSDIIMILIIKLNNIFFLSWINKYMLTNKKITDFFAPKNGSKVLPPIKRKIIKTRVSCETFVKNRPRGRRSQDSGGTPERPDFV